MPRYSESTQLPIAWNRLAHIEPPNGGSAMTPLPGKQATGRKDVIRIERTRENRPFTNSSTGSSVEEKIRDFPVRLFVGSGLVKAGSGVLRDDNGPWNLGQGADAAQGGLIWRGGLGALPGRQIRLVK